MDKEIAAIETFLVTLHSSPDVPKESSVPLRKDPETKHLKESEIQNQPVPETKVPLDMRLLQNRIDSVGVMKYYKDLKNDRIRTEKNVKYVRDTDTLMTEITEHELILPWKRADKYTRRRRIAEFAKTYGRENHYSATDIKNLSSQLLELFDTKKLALKNIAFDEQGVNIVSILEYRTG